MTGITDGTLRDAQRVGIFFAESDMIKSPLMRSSAAAALLVATQVVIGSAAAQADPNADVVAATTRAEARAKQYKAEKDEIDNRAARDKARVDALGLPSFKNETTVNQGGLNIESWMLASTALDGAASRIKTAVETVAPSARILVVGGSDEPNFGQLSALEVEFTELTTSLEGACARAGPEVSCTVPSVQHSFGPAGIAAVIGAASGLLSQKTDISGVDVTFDVRVLAAAVAGELGDRGIVPALATASKSAEDAANPIVKSFKKLVGTATQARAVRDGLVEMSEAKTKLTPGQKNALGLLNVLLPRYDALYSRLTVQDSNGVVPLAAAVRLQRLLGNAQPLVLRVDIEKVGGSIIKRENVLTMFGADPVAVSGGLIASFRLSDPYSGTVKTRGVVTCRTTLTSLRRVQDDSWRPSGAARPKEKAPAADAGPAALCRLNRVASTV